MNNNFIDSFDKEKIKSLKKVYVTLDELQDLFNINTYMTLVDLISYLINENVITPIKNKKNTTGKIPSLYIKYRIIEDKAEIMNYEDEIRKLSPYFKIDKYLKNIERYKEHREVIHKLDSFFKTKKEKLNIRLSINERAYQIWGYEKMLDQSLTKSVISFNDLEKILNYYLTPEPFFDYVPEHKSHMTILIIENKDTWYTLRKIMQENNKKSINILGIEIDGLVYGEGNKITKENAIYEYQTQVLNSNCKFVYWGDIDFMGIDLYLRVKLSNPLSDINLFGRFV